VLVKRQEAIDAIQAGYTDVSCGYDAKYKQLSPGKGSNTKSPETISLSASTGGGWRPLCNRGFSPINVKKGKANNVMV
jgi:hypothetical protein